MLCIVLFCSQTIGKRSHVHSNTNQDYIKKYGSREGQFLRFRSAELYLRGETRTYSAEFHCGALPPRRNEDLQRGIFTAELHLRSETNPRVVDKK